MVPQPHRIKGSRLTIPRARSGTIPLSDDDFPSPSRICWPIVGAVSGLCVMLLLVLLIVLRDGKRPAEAIPTQVSVPTQPAPPDVAVAKIVPAPDDSDDDVKSLASPPQVLTHAAANPRRSRRATRQPKRPAAAFPPYRDRSVPSAPQRTRRPARRTTATRLTSWMIRRRPLAKPFTIRSSSSCCT